MQDMTIKNDEIEAAKKAEAMKQLLDELEKAEKSGNDNGWVDIDELDRYLKDIIDEA